MKNGVTQWPKASENKKTMIEVKNLKKNYGKTTVLDIAELTIQKGEAFGLVGNNGAGKTTFFRLILDLIKASAGEIHSNGVDVKATNAWKYYTGSYLDQSFLIDFLTPEEYFEFINNVHGLSKADLTDFYEEYDEFFNGEVIGKRKYIRDLSQGNRQKVGISAALMAKPEIIILDEPFNGLDPTTQIRLVKKLNQLREDPERTLLISSHDLNHIAEVCSRVTILEKGLIIKDIEASENTMRELENYFGMELSEVQVQTETEDES